MPYSKACVRATIVAPPTLASDTSSLLTLKVHYVPGTDRGLPPYCGKLADEYVLI